MKKAVFVISGLKGGGAEKVVLNLYRCLEKYQGFECHIISISNNVEHDINNFNVHFCDDFMSFSKKGINRLTYRKKSALEIDKYIKDNIGKDCLVFSNMILSDKIMSKSKLNVKFIIHSSYYDVFIKGRRLISKIKNKIMVNNIYSKKELIFVSKNSLDSYKKEFDIGNKYHVIYNPVPIDEISILAQEYNVASDNYLLHIGRFNKVKRHDRLLNALVYTQQDVKLILLGNGKEEESIRCKIKELNLDQRVTIVDFKKNPYPYLKKAIGLILTSDYEGLPTVILEALALKKPIISTKCGGVCEIISNDNILTSNASKDIATKIDLLFKERSTFQDELKEQFHPEYVANKYASLK